MSGLPLKTSPEGNPERLRANVARLIRTPDGGLSSVENDGEYRAFIRGFKAALMCYGIYKDGVQRIGCMATPIKDAMAQLEKENTICP